MKNFKKKKTKMPFLGIFENFEKKMSFRKLVHNRGKSTITTFLGLVGTKWMSSNMAFGW